MRGETLLLSNSADFPRAGSGTPYSTPRESGTDASSDVRVTPIFLVLATRSHERVTIIAQRVPLPHSAVMRVPRAAGGFHVRGWRWARSAPCFVVI